MSQPELMTVAEVCENYRLGRTTFYREVAKGRIAIRKLGNATRVARTDMESWLNALPKFGGQANDLV